MSWHQGLGTPNNLQARLNSAATNGDPGTVTSLGLGNGFVDRYLSRRRSAPHLHSVTFLAPQITPVWRSSVQFCEEAFEEHFRRRAHGGVMCGGCVGLGCRTT